MVFFNPTKVYRKEVLYVSFLNIIVFFISSTKKNKALCGTVVNILITIIIAIKIYHSRTYGLKTNIFVIEQMYIIPHNLCMWMPNMCKVKLKGGGHSQNVGP
jgi:hypothetical protein